MAQERDKETAAPWQKLVAPYRSADDRRALFMTANTVLGLLGSWAAMHWLLQVAWWAPLFVVPIGAGFLVRLFIIQHDCGHGSFFSSQKWNDAVGTVCGVVLLTPYYGWRQSHATHHAGSGNLDCRGIGDVPLLTKAEYLERGAFGRLAYRVVRNPIVLFLIGPLFVFFIAQRVPFLFVFRKLSRKAWWNVHVTTFGWFGGMIAVYAWFGTDMWVLVPTAWLAMATGVWLFYMQHNYESVYFTRTDGWDYTDAGIHGSSYYKLPRVLAFFTGYIGYHHIHHLMPKIPCYRLPEVHEKHEWFHQATTLGFFESLRCASFRLFDEERGKMIDFATAHADERAALASAQAVLNA